ncbi:MAG: GAF domain-containing protein, partial [Rubrobacteraceae bacterium]
PLIKYVSKEFPYHLIFAFLGILAATGVNFVLSHRFVFRQSAAKDLNVDLPPKEIAAEISDELKADKTILMQVPGLSPLGDPLSSQLNAADRSVIEMVANTAHPTLTITGPRRLPQARTNARWLNSLAVPVFQDERTVGVVYATRNSTEPFTEEDLHWLTSYVGAAAPLFEQPTKSNKNPGD